MNLIPLVVASLILPWVAVSVSCSALLPAAASPTVTPSPPEVEKEIDEFSLTVTAVGALTVGGGVGGVTVNPILAEPLRLSPESASATRSESEPVNPEL